MLVGLKKCSIIILKVSGVGLNKKGFIIQPDFLAGLLCYDFWDVTQMV